VVCPKRQDLRHREERAVRKAYFDLNFDAGARDDPNDCLKKECHSQYVACTSSPSAADCQDALKCVSDCGSSSKCAWKCIKKHFDPTKPQSQEFTALATCGGTHKCWNSGSAWEMLDHSPEELSKLRGYRAPSTLPDSGFPKGMAKFDSSGMDVSSLPAVFDWRVKGAVSPVKVQGQGSSCWSFSSVGAIEGAVSIAKGQPAVSLSNQQIMDCSHVSCLDAINGTMTGAFENIVGWGGTLDSDKDYPYRDADCVTWDARCNPSMIDPRCKFWCPPHKCQANHTAVAKIKGYKHTIIGNETDLLLAISQGPVAVAMDASMTDFAGYTNGVYENAACANKKEGLDHAVLAVGWGTTKDGKDYYIVKNSWGTNWGMQGYFYLARNKGNMCGIATDASFPTV